MCSVFYLRNISTKLTIIFSDKNLADLFFIIFFTNCELTFLRFLPQWQFPLPSGRKVYTPSSRILHNLQSCSISFNFACHSSSGSTSNRNTLSFISRPSSVRLLDLASLVHRENIFCLYSVSELPIK